METRSNPVKPVKKTANQLNKTLHCLFVGEDFLCSLIAWITSSLEITQRKLRANRMK